MKKMDPFVKEAWLSALRSGEYRQGWTRLYNVSMGQAKFCCLGVLAHQADELDKQGRVCDPSGNEFMGAFPENILEKVGLDEKAQRVLIRMNDDLHMDFEGIARWIEEQL